MLQNTFAARAGRWSAANRKKAIFGWLAFVVLAVAIGAGSGMVTPSNDNSTVGDSGRGDKLVSDHYPDSASESVLIQGRHGQTYRDADLRAAVDQTVKAVSGFGTVENIDSPFAKGNRGQISPDGRSVLVNFDVKGDDDAAQTAIDPIEAAVTKVGADHPSLLGQDFHRHQAGLLLKSQPSRRSCRLRRQHEGGADIGMAGKRNFGAHGEDADLRVVGAVLRRQHEGGLGIVELGGDRLQLRGIEAARIRDHRQRIAAERPFGEHVQSDVVDLHGAPLLRFT